MKTELKTHVKEVKVKITTETSNNKTNQQNLKQGKQKGITKRKCKTKGNTQRKCKPTAYMAEFFLENIVVKVEDIREN